MTAASVLMLATGVLLFLSEAVKCYNSFAFWVKNDVAGPGDPVRLHDSAAAWRPPIRRASRPAGAGLVGATSILLWFGRGLGRSLDRVLLASEIRPEGP